MDLKERGTPAVIGRTFNFDDGDAMNHDDGKGLGSVPGFFGSMLHVASLSITRGLFRESYSQVQLFADYPNVG